MSPRKLRNLSTARKTIMAVCTTYHQHQHVPRAFRLHTSSSYLSALKNDLTLREKGGLAILINIKLHQSAGTTHAVRTNNLPRAQKISLRESHNLPTALKNDLGNLRNLPWARKMRPRELRNLPVVCKKTIPAAKSGSPC